MNLCGILYHQNCASVYLAKDRLSSMDIFKIRDPSRPAWEIPQETASQHLSCTILVHPNNAMHLNEIFDRFDIPIALCSALGLADYFIAAFS